MTEELEMSPDFDKNRVALPFDINKIEFWGATILYVLSIFMLVSGAARQGMSPGWGPNAFLFGEHNLKYNYYTYYLVPMFFRNTFFYGGYLILTFYLVPKMIGKKNLLVNSILFLLVFAIIGIVCGVTDTWLKAYLFAEYRTEEVNNMVSSSNATFAAWLMLIFAFYCVIKSTAEYLFTHLDNLQEKYQAITKEGIIAFILWMFTFFLMLISNAPKELLSVYGIVIPISIGLYWFSLHTLIPNVQHRKRKFLVYLSHLFLILLLTLLPVSLIVIGLFTDGPDSVIAVNSINAVFQIFFTAPLSWFVYRQRMSINNELTTLKTALGKSSATLDSLKSQINPHFLFNALNTLYGTSLQENAERTSEGIQKLGDMMRFMLEENMQDKITLNREIDYINNYISLQKLRTQSSPNIIIQTTIDETVNNLQITPMLLIPFIENAFKHGISLREKSHIRISLHIDGNSLFFDVYNSVHPKLENTLEKNHHGIGLENVKQRLQMLYKKKHELIIRENANEYFVHLTMQLA